MSQLHEWKQKVNDLARAGKPFLFLVDYDLNVPLCYSLEELPKTICYSLSKDRERAKQATPLTFTPTKYNDYKTGFTVLQKHLSRGDSYLVNYTIETPIETRLSLREIYESAVSKYKVLIKDRFVCFSPETFIQITETGKISTFPMKGTIDASISNAHEIILSDKKETAEHATIVDLLRNDLSKVAQSVTVEKYRYIDKIETNDGALLQVSSIISGQLEAHWQAHLADILLEMLPAGSVTGAPKQKTIEIIAEAETHKRGYYTGVFGVFDGKGLDSAVIIRFIEQRQGKLYYKSGGGITTQSNAEAEYNEANSKIYVPIG